MSTTSGYTGSRREKWAIQQVTPRELDAAAAFVEEEIPGIRTDEWLRWKYNANPWSDRPSLYAAKRETTLCGVIGFVPLCLVDNRHSLDSIMFGDCIISAAGDSSALKHELFTQSLKSEARRGRTLAFEISQKRAAQHVLEKKWFTLGELDTFVRIQSLSPLAGDVSRVLDPVLRKSTETIIGMRRWVDSIQRTLSTVPVDVLHMPGSPNSPPSFVEQNPPYGLRPARTEAYYSWRFNNPLATYHTFIQYRHGSPVAMIITERIENDGVVVTDLAEVWVDHTAGLVAKECIPLLGILLDEHADADLLRAPGGVLPAESLKRLGFLSQQQFPASYLFPPSVIRATALRIKEEGDLSRAGMFESAQWNLQLAVNGLGWSSQKNCSIP